MSGRKLEQLTAQLAALREIGRAINAAWELEATLDLITCRTAEVMDMDSCSIYLLDGGGEPGVRDRRDAGGRGPARGVVADGERWDDGPHHHPHTVSGPRQAVTTRPTARLRAGRTLLV